MLESEKLNSVIAELPTISEAGVVYRFIKAKYLNEPLSSIGSLKVGGRYNIKNQFEALYLANNPITALREIRAIVETSSEIIASRIPPYVLLSIEYNLRKIVDLTDDNCQKALVTNIQELTGNWLYMQSIGQIAPTQSLGLAVYQSKNIEALKVPSATAPNQYNLVIFTQNLSSESLLTVYDNTGTIQAQLP
ncbi:MAG: RES family NAD+ phosphorylase [Waterburya sp.]